MDYLEYSVFIGIFLLFSLIFFYLFYNLNLPEIKKKESDPISDLALGGKRKGVLAVCPLCGYFVGPGEQVHAKLIYLPDKRKRVEIRGCDRCLHSNKYCPRCKSQLGNQDIVFALLKDRTKSEKKAGKKDLLHIEGCIHCFKR